MAITEAVQEYREAMQKQLALLDDPQPGLMTWNDMLVRGMWRVQRALDAMTGVVHPKPHAMATKLAWPCARCGYPWQRPGINRADREATEYDVHALCARCGARQP